MTIWRGGKGRGVRCDCKFIEPCHDATKENDASVRMFVSIESLELDARGYYFAAIWARPISYI